MRQIFDETINLDYSQIFLFQVETLCFKAFRQLAAKNFFHTRLWIKRLESSCLMNCNS